jgi:tetratricopeptide (TPR) repeat protein
MTAATIEPDRWRIRRLLSWLIVAAVLAGIYAFDMFLANVERTELAREANSLYREAQTLESGRRVNDAIRLYRRVLAINRGNLEYQIALGRALVTGKQFADALPVFDEVLQRYPDDGRANLEVARLKEATGDTSAAASYFHRAIYGSWPQDAQAQRIGARMELIDMLVRAGRQRELLAELLPLEDEAPNDPALRLKIAGLFITAGSLSRAADAYRAILHEHPDDERAYGGLGEAELQLGDYRAAQSAFVSALRRKPDDAGVRQRLALTTQLAQLDPTPRRLPARERLERSQKILTLTIQALETCAAGQGSAEVDGIMNRRQRALRPKRSPEEDPIETNLSIAEDAWNYVRRACPEQSKPDDPVAVVMGRLERRP